MIGTLAIRICTHQVLSLNQHYMVSQSLYANNVLSTLEL